MFSAYKALRRNKDREFCLIFKRLIKKSEFFFDEVKSFRHAKRKAKITIVERKFQANKQTTVVESKPAADVIKKLNWEYKYLYGPVQTSKLKTYDFSKVFESNQVIQHETKIPIIEPTISNINQNTLICNKEQICDLSSILTFPLVNKCVHPTSKINELNYLRKHLELLCKDSKVPSVSLILQSTMPKERIEILDKWKQDMIKQLGEEGFERYQKELFDNGTSLHHNISSFLSSTPESELQIKKGNIGHWKSLKGILLDIKDVKLLEEFVVHPFLCYKGVVDCFAKYKNHLVVIDWKTSKKSKAQIKNTYDNPLQIAAYIGALNFDPKFQYLVSKGLIVAAYENGMPATAHFMDEPNMKYYWNEWIKRVKQFWEMRNSEIKNS